MLVSDSLEVYAQSGWSGDGEMLLAEAGRRSRRRRNRQPPPEPADTEESAGGEGDGAVSDEGSADEGEASTTPLDAGDDAEGGDAAPTSDAGDPAISGGSGTSLRRSNRMDFDERLVKGQGARSGAVYLFKRTPRKLPELVSLRTSYRQRIIEPVLGTKIAKNAQIEPEETPTKTEAVATPTPEAPHAEKAPPEEAGPTKAELARERRRQRRLRAARRRRRARRAAQKKAQ